MRETNAWCYGCCAHSFLYYFMNALFFHSVTAGCKPHSPARISRACRRAAGLRICEVLCCIPEVWGFFAGLGAEIALDGASRGAHPAILECTQSAISARQRMGSFSTHHIRTVQGAQTQIRNHPTLNHLRVRHSRLPRIMMQRRRREPNWCLKIWNLIGCSTLRSTLRNEHPVTLVRR
jgi:hypothetical protein